MSKKLKRFFENYLKSSHRTTPVRSPFSHSSYYSSGQVENGKWKELTDLYNTTYRTHHGEEGFREVMYSEPLNIMVWKTKEEAFDEDCVLTFGIKAARGFRKDYRFIDMSIPGAGRLAASEEEADEVIENPIEAIKDIRPEYARNLGTIPIETREAVNEAVKKELNEVLDRNVKVKLSESQNKKARKLLRKRQIEEDLTNIENALIDLCARQLRNRKNISKQEKRMIARE